MLSAVEGRVVGGGGGVVITYKCGGMVLRSGMVINNNMRVTPFIGITRRGFEPDMEW